MLWQRFRVPFLVLTFSSSLLVLSQLALAPTSKNPKAPPYVFPREIALSGWRFLGSRPLQGPVVERQGSGRQYLYRQDDLQLDIKMRLLFETNGDIWYLLREHTAIAASEASSTLKYAEGVGFYSSFTSGGYAYLSSCINPRGGTTVTAAQFAYNRYRYDLSFERLLAWLRNEVSLRDKRCLWAHLSIPVRERSLEGAYQTLEDVWLSWYEWWFPRFSKA